jgi:alanine racemase
MEGGEHSFPFRGEDPASVEVQWSRFETALKALGERQLSRRQLGGCVELKQSLDLIRPGIFIYGTRPAATFDAAPGLEFPRLGGQPAAGVYGRGRELRGQWRAPRVR